MRLHGRCICTVNGIPTPVISADASHGVAQPIGVGSITMSLPLPDHIMATAARGMRSPVRLWFGFDETTIRQRFVGNVVADSMQIDTTSMTATFDLQGHAVQMARPIGEEVEFGPHIALKTMWEAYAYWMGMPSWQVDPITYIDGATPVTFGANPDIDSAAHIVPGDGDILDYLGRKSRLFGFYGFETPGSFRVQRVSGKPVGTVHASFVLGQQGYRWSRKFTTENVVNDNRVEGPTYPDADGVSIPIRSFALSVSPSPYIVGGYMTETVSDKDLVRQDLVDAVRQVAEVDKSEPHLVIEWEDRGRSDLYPGDVVHLDVPVFGLSGNYWLMSTRDSFDENAYITTYTAWAGAGTALPSGTDKIELAVPGAWHVGDEWIAHYKIPSPSRGPIEIPFTVPQRFTSFAIRGLGHGANSHMLDGANTESKVSKLEVWQGGDKALGATDLPVMPENYDRALPYSRSEHWTAFRLPVPGQLEPGSAVLKFVPGEHSQLGEGFKLDDFEIKDLVLECYGSGTPLYERSAS